MSERLKVFIYCGITAIVTAVVVSVWQPQRTSAQMPITSTNYTITHIVKFGDDGVFGITGNKLIVDTGSGAQR